MKTLSVILLLVGFIALQNTANAQLAYLHSVSPINDSIDSRVTAEPEFKGGYDALCEYLNENLEYPYLAKIRGIEGRVMVEFTIKETGKIEEVKLLESVVGSIDHEALRLVKNMPKWVPAFQNGVAKSVRYQLPIKFSID